VYAGRAVGSNSSSTSMRRNSSETLAELLSADAANKAAAAAAAAVSAAVTRQTNSDEPASSITGADAIVSDTDPMLLSITSALPIAYNIALLSLSVYFGNVHTGALAVYYAVLYADTDTCCMQYEHAGDSSTSSYEQEHYAPIGTVVNGDSLAQSGEK
jgi:hypothetical protein